MKETWKNISGYEKYQVSTLGQVKSYKYREERILKSRKNRRGYLYINLCSNGKYKSHSIHRLVATAFLGISDMTVNHKDGNKTNNNIQNLEWLYLDENKKHAQLNNLIPRGERNQRSKLKNKQVFEIRKLRESGLPYYKIGERYGVSRICIMDIIKGITWSHI